MDFKYGIKRIGTYNNKSVYKVQGGYLIGVGNLSLQSSKCSVHWAYRHNGKYAGAIPITSAEDAFPTFVKSCEKLIELQGAIYRTKRVFPLSTKPKYHMGVLIPAGMWIVNRDRDEKLYLEAKTLGADGMYNKHHLVTTVEQLKLDIEYEKKQLAIHRQQYLNSFELSFDEAVFLYPQNPLEVCPKQQYQDHLAGIIEHCLSTIVHTTHVIQESA